MGRFIVKRLLLGFLTWIMLVTLVFVFLRLSPGGPFSANERVTDELQNQLNIHYHLNLSLFEQYLHFIEHLLNGSFGPSYYFIGQNVEAIVQRPMLISLILGIVVMLLSALVSVLITLLVYLKNNSRLFDLFKMSHIIVISLPLFLLAPLLQFCFSFYFKIVPIRYNQSILSIILPILILSFKPTFNFSRILVNQVETLKQSQLLLFARSKGLSDVEIFFKHILKNILISCISHFTFYFIYLISGVFIIEHIFAIPGISSFFVTAIQERDYPMIMSVIIVYGSIFIILNILMDVLIKKLDPRIEMV